MKVHKKFKDHERKTDPKRKIKTISKKRNLNPFETKNPKHRKMRIEEE